MSRVYAIVNQKGGVGKTTTAINLATYLAEAGRRVLLVDIDPQSSTTSGIGAGKNRETATIYEVLVKQDVSLNDVVVNTARPTLRLVPSTQDLAAAEIELVDLPEREFRLRTALESARKHHDYILIDCPPSLGLLTVNALVAADGVMIPLQCEYLALEGLSQLLNTVKRVRAKLNPNLYIAGVVLTMYDARTKLAGEVVREVRSHFPKEVFQTIITRNVRLSEAPSYGQSILDYDPTSPGALAYRALAEEVMSRG
ncbi:MAG TPA: AAA family ATPase [Ktedonobacterales bacterium]|jgi:chromosome partitioning protein